MIIENFYSRLKIGWSILRNKFRDSHVDCDKIFEICCALTNYLLKYSPLRAEDGEYCNALLKEIQERALEVEEARKIKMKEYAEKRKRNYQITDKELKKINPYNSK